MVATVAPCVVSCVHCLSGANCPCDICSGHLPGSSRYLEEFGAVTAPILQKGKLRLREVL